jgi:primosomal protein N' (replication factor Y)
MSDRFALVALPLPLATPYTYRIPETEGDRVVPGARVVVPVRRRELIGVVVDADTAPPTAAAKDILAVPDAEPALSPALLATAEWISGYYAAPLGLTLKSILPGGMWGESRVIISVRDGGHDVGGVTLSSNADPSSGSCMKPWRRWAGALQYGTSPSSWDSGKG